MEIDLSYQLLNVHSLLHSFSKYGSWLHLFSDYSIDLTITFQIQFSKNDNNTPILFYFNQE